MSGIGDNDHLLVGLGPTGQELDDLVPWPEARERLAACEVEGQSIGKVDAENLLCAIFTGRAPDGWRPMRPNELGKAVEAIPAGSPLEINDRGEIRAAR